MGHERLIKATIANTLQWDENEERAIDQVAAIGFATKRDETGSAILRIDALDANSTRHVIFLVSRHIKHRYHLDWSYAKRVSLAVLHEYMRPNCIYCGGKGETHIKNAKVCACQYCGGSGLHCYSNLDRVALMGKTRYNEKVYEEALNFVREAVRGVVVRSTKRLGELKGVSA